MRASRSRINSDRRSSIAFFCNHPTSIDLIRARVSYLISIFFAFRFRSFLFSQLHFLRPLCHASGQDTFGNIFAFNIELNDHVRYQLILDHVDCFIFCGGKTFENDTTRTVRLLGPPRFDDLIQNFRSQWFTVLQISFDILFFGGQFFELEQHDVQTEHVERHLLPQRVYRPSVLLLR